jgi:hypothetical protein
MSPFKKLLESAKTEDERKGFLKMIQMMLCLKNMKGSGINGGTGKTD